MKKIYLMRHAKAIHNSKIDDHERPLDAAGIDACGRIAPYLQEHNYIPERILCSTSVRTHETARLLMETVYKNCELQLLPSLYQASFTELLRHIEGLEDTIQSVLLVGHNPGMHELAATLAVKSPHTDKDRIAKHFPPASFVAFHAPTTSWKKIHSEIRLDAFHTP